MPAETTARWRDRIRSRLTRRQLIWAAAGLVVVLLLILAFRPDSLPVETGVVTRGPLEITIDAEGVTRVLDRFQVATPVTGRVRRIEFDEGDRVRQGDVLAVMTPAPLDPQTTTQARAAVAVAEARLQEATARVEQTRTAMELARRNAVRILNLVEEGGMSVEAGERAQVEAETAAREYEAAVSRVRAAEGEIRSARAALADVDPEGVNGALTNVTAPASGRILRIFERSERVIPAGTPLLDIGDAAGLDVVIDVLSTDAVRISPGDVIRIEEWGGPGNLFGRVRVVEPSAFTRVSALGVEEQRVNVVGDLLDSRPELGDNYRVEASIIVWSVQDALLVPTAALFQIGEGWAVFTVRDGRARLVPVEIGRRGVADAELVGGLSEGDAVILYPSDQLEDGMRVRPAP